VFLVEGDSAGGSAKMGRDKECQAVLPLRGKVLNTWEVERDRLFANTEIHDIAVAIGVDPHGPNDTPDLSGLRYGKVCILSDADVDGSHIQVLLLTLFFRHFPKLIESAMCMWPARRCSGWTRRRAARSPPPRCTRWTKAN
jgi:topoisomerase-4 subunit B